MGQHPLRCICPKCCEKRSRESRIFALQSQIKRAEENGDLGKIRLIKEELEEAENQEVIENFEETKNL